MKTKLSEPSSGKQADAKDDFRELRNRDIVSQINKMRKVDNWTNWRFLALEYSYLSVVIGLGFLVCVAWSQSLISTWAFVPLALAVSVLILSLIHI